jgi:hypothetical protein
VVCVSFRVFVLCESWSLFVFVFFVCFVISGVSVCLCLFVSCVPAGCFFVFVFV